MSAKNATIAITMTVTSASMAQNTLQILSVTTTISAGFPKYLIGGLSTEKEKRIRIKISALLRELAIRIPPKRITTEISPYILGIESNYLEFAFFASLIHTHFTTQPHPGCLLGSLDISGKLHAPPGTLAVALRAWETGQNTLLVPSSIAKPLAAISTAKVFGFTHFSEYLHHLRVPQQPVISRKKLFFNTTQKPHYFSQILGQETVCRALTIALAGKHNLLLSGPPGNGKTLIARSAAELQPPLSLNELQELQKLHTETNTLLTDRPFIQPHHSCTYTQLFGSKKTNQIGDISRAHTGILFLDELPEFSAEIRSSLKKVLEDKVIALKQPIPCNCITLAACNPCLCGYAKSTNSLCTCTQSEIHRYENKIPKPLKERFEMHIHVPLLTANKITPSSKNTWHTYQKSREEIQRVRSLSKESEYIALLELTSSAKILLNKAHDKLHLSVRSRKACQKVAQTIALLDKESSITADHIAEALQYRIQ